MLCEIGPFAVQVPPGFVDRTRYGFARARPEQTLLLETWPLRRATSPDALLSTPRADLRSTLGSDLAEGPVERATLLGAPASIATFGAAHASGTEHVYLAAAALPDGLAARISLVSATPLRDLFDQVVAFAERAAHAPLRAPPPGWVHRLAGPVRLALPEALEPPRTRRLESEDEALRVTLATVDPHATPAAWLASVPLPHGQRAVTTDEGQAHPRVAGAAASEGWCTLCCVDAAGHEDARYALRRLVVPAGDDGAVAIVAVARVRFEDAVRRLDEAWGAMMNGIRRRDGAGE